MDTLFVNAKEILLVEQDPSVNVKKGEQMSKIDTISNGYLYIKDGLIEDFGPMDSIDFSCYNGVKIEDVAGRTLMPAFCDSHTHIVYAGSREKEFADKIKGLSYKEIAARGGGILNSVELLHNTSEKELYSQSMERVREILSFGTAAVEIKSGYGLSLEDELKMLRVAKMIEESSPLTVKRSFLGAHAVPARYKDNRVEYVNEIINCMIPVIASEDLAEFVDVFTEDGFFSVEDTDRIFNAAIKYGLRPKVHANQMSISGGVEVGVKYNALSVDHLEFTGPDQFKVLKESDTIATLLPGSTFFLEMDYAPARAMIDYGLPVALATNYNPGSSPSGDMKFMMVLASLKMKMTPEEVINAATINGAYAMGLSQTHGSISKGKFANIIVTNSIPSYMYIPYAISAPLVNRLFIEGKEVMLS